MKYIIFPLLLAVTSANANAAFHISGSSYHSFGEAQQGVTEAAHRMCPNGATRTSKWSLKRENTWVYDLCGPLNCNSRLVVEFLAAADFVCK